MPPPVRYDENGNPINAEAAPQGAVRYDENGNPVRPGYRPQRSRTTDTRQAPRISEDVDGVRSGVSGIHRGVAAIPGMFGDVQDLSGQAVGVVQYWGLRASGKSDDEARAEVQRSLDFNRDFQRARGTRLPNTEEINDAALSVQPESVREWTDHEPQTDAGRIAHTAGSFVPQVLIPGSGAMRLTRVAAPTVGTEVGGAIGQAVGGDQGESVGRALGGITGAIGGELAAPRIAPQQSATQLRRIEEELRNVGMTRQGARSVTARMQAGAANDDIQQAISTELGENLPLARMPRVARQLGIDPEAEGRALERFGPMTSGERTGNVNDRLLQSDYEQASGRARSRIDGFNERRAPMIAENARNIATRGLDPQSLEGGGGGVAANNLRGVYSAMREHRSALYDAADEAAATAGPINHNTVGTDLLNRTQAMIDRLRLARDPAHERWLREFEALQDDISANRATWADVHTVRRQLNDAWAAANPADRRVLDAFKRELDGFRQANAPAEYTSAISNADRYSSEMSQMFSTRARVELGPNGEFTGNNDIAGSRMENILNTDLNERSIARMFINENGLPSPAGTALARRLRAVNDELLRSTGQRQAPSLGQNQQSRAQYSIRDGNRQTVGSRGFDADAANPGQYGVEQPSPEMQSVREMILDELVVNRLAVRGAGEPIPAQVIASRLRNALSERGGREMMRQLFTEAEMRELDDLQRYFERIRTPTGAARSGTPAGQQRHALETARAIIGRILSPVDRIATAGLAGLVADGWVAGMAESRAAEQAARMTAAPGPYRPQPPPLDLTARNTPPTANYGSTVLPLTGAIGRQNEDTEDRRLDR